MTPEALLVPTEFPHSIGGGRSERLATLPPSARTVYALLEREGPRTHKELVQSAVLPGRTVRFAIARLLGAGVVEECPSFRDARQSYFRAAPDGVPRREPPSLLTRRVW